MHGETKSERIRFRVKASVEARARKWADRRGLSLSAYVREALRRQMDEDLRNDIHSKTTSDDGRD